MKESKGFEESSHDLTGIEIKINGKRTDAPAVEIIQLHERHNLRSSTGAATEPVLASWDEPEKKEDKNMKVGIGPLGFLRLTRLRRIGQQRFNKDMYIYIHNTKVKNCVRLS